MTTLKIIKNRIKSVTNTKKITQSMKIVSASKYARAEQDLQNARPMGEVPRIFYQEIKMISPVEMNAQLLVALTSDNGLCGAIHSGIAKVIHKNVRDDPILALKTKLICIGQYSMSLLSRTFPEKLIWAAKHVGKKTITFLDAALIAMKINKCITEHNFTITKIYYNQCLSRMSYKAEVIDLYHKGAVKAGKKFLLYDEIEEEILESYLEFSYVVLIYWMMKESACSELAARIVAMDNATKNAGKMTESLNHQLHRTRQAMITNDLTEIIAGANTVSK
ncbi:ATP synthase subunit gamma, mitochondrial-like [Athalia rosae]|uniref:ATP synthase subunit gamma, mitochondrial-like n=1 Tax=Athalia rosae TaxID=37344 RepID=UPI000625C735|nr:ATP synthase subunit gamma, mitochondrial-like [Athalia rosae]